MHDQGYGQYGEFARPSQEAKEGQLLPAFFSRQTLKACPALAVFAALAAALRPDESFIYSTISCYSRARGSRLVSHAHTEETTPTDSIQADDSSNHHLESSACQLIPRQRSA